MTIYHSDITGPQDVMAILRNLPLVGGLLLLAAAGAGPWSLDATRAKAGHDGLNRMEMRRGHR